MSWLSVVDAFESITILLIHLSLISRSSMEAITDFTWETIACATPWQLWCSGTGVHCNSTYSTDSTLYCGMNTMALSGRTTINTRAHIHSNKSDQILLICCAPLIRWSRSGTGLWAALCAALWHKTAHDKPWVSDRYYSHDRCLIQNSTLNSFIFSHSTGLSFIGVNRVFCATTYTQ